MKTNINLSFFLAISLFVFPSLFLSCSDDDGDTTAPVINLKAPVEGAVLKIGSDVHFDLELLDNEMLASYKVDIHNNFDSHTHSKASNSDNDTAPFAFQKSWDVSGLKKTSIHHHEIIISENATPGKYHLVVYCTDAAGNESHIARNIELSHEGEDHDHDHHHHHEH